MTGAGLLARPLASFVGRTEAIVEVGGLVRHHQLVTLIGAGGCGKTRLAIEVAARVQRAFADGGAFVDLAPIESPALVAGAFAVATGVHEVGGAPLVESLRDALARRELLVVVDNCERVAAACAELLVGLLPRCPRVAVLATSRSALGVPGEVAWRVPSLTLPTDDGCDVQSSEAGRLLLDRAGLARPGFTVSTTEAPVAAAICRRLDGIPLAIELAACRLRALDLAELAKGLDDRFRLLSSGPRSAPPRQRTLEASIAWSHELLSEAERVLFRRLGVFAASFTCDEAATVCSDAELPASTVPALLRTLIDASLVQLERSRHRMLETVREYARLRLVESGEEVAIRHRHLDHVLLVTAWFNHEADGPGLDAANERLEPMVDDPVRACHRRVAPRRRPSPVLGGEEPQPGRPEVVGGAARRGHRGRRSGPHASAAREG